MYKNNIYKYKKYIYFLLYTYIYCSVRNILKYHLILENIIYIILLYTVFIYYIVFVTMLLSKLFILLKICWSMKFITF